MPLAWKGVRCEEEVSSSSLEKGSGEGVEPLPRNFYSFKLKMLSFGAFWSYFYS